MSLSFGFEVDLKNTAGTFGLNLPTADLYLFFKQIFSQCKYFLGLFCA